MAASSGGNRRSPSKTRTSASPKAQHLHLGQKGEDCAERFLVERGHTVLERRFRTKTGEIDLISRSGQHLYFVEVKTRKAGKDAYGGGIAALPIRRQRRMIQTARWYLSTRSLEGLVPHFSLIVIQAKGNEAALRFLPDAFSASD